MQTLQILVIILIYGALVVAKTSREDRQGINIWSNMLSGAMFFMVLDLAWCFDWTKTGYQFYCSLEVLPAYGINLSFGVDQMSLLFLILVIFVMGLCIIFAENTRKDYKKLILCLLLIELCLILSFISTNVFFFYVFFESVLIPMYFLIGTWGARPRKINAAFYIFLYTLVGSFFFLFGLLLIYSKTHSFEIQTITRTIFSLEEQIMLFFFLFIPFAVKIPLLPFHLWLLEAHVEAPTIGSVVLASLLLKLGGYGFLRYTMPIVPDACVYFNGLITGLCIISIIYSSLSAIRQNDFKRIIAYSSIAHMSLVTLGLYSFTGQGINGGVYLMLSHGIVSAALFFCIGILYDRHHTRSLKHYSGLIAVMPLFGTFFFLFTCANMSFPGTANFAGELLILIGVFETNPFSTFFCATSVFLSAVYSVWLYNRIFFGTLKVEKENIAEYAELNRREFLVLFALLVGMIFLGVCSSFITDLIDPFTQELLASIKAKK